MFTAVFPRSSRYCVLALIFAGSVFAQSEEHSATVGIAGGLTTVVGHDAGRLDHGGNIQVSGGYFFTHNLGITAAFQFSNLGITGSELARLNEPDGSARAYTLTFDPTVRFSLGHGMTGYLLGGGGYLRRTVEFTQPVLAQTVIFDPWWGYFGPALVPVNQVLGSVTSNAGALDVGGGINFPVGSGMKIFLETRYVHGFTGHSGTSLVPIMFGVRW
jgi:opacity protein-like surface antigen